MSYPGNAGAESQAANVIPPRQGSIIAFAIDTQSRAKDISGLNLEQDASAPLGGKAFLTLYANVKWWFFMSSVTASVDETAVDAAPAPLTLKNNSCIEVQAGQTVDIRINRSVDKFIVVKGAALGTVRGWLSSHSFGGV